MYSGYCMCNLHFYVFLNKVIDLNEKKKKKKHFYDPITFPMVKIKPCFVTYKY